MPWNKNDYPNSMKNLPESVRNKAIEIANALLDEQELDEGIAIATAISRAKDWAANRGMETEPTSSTSRPTDVKEHGEDRYVVPQDGKWAVKKEKDEIEATFDTKKEAEKAAKKEAAQSGATVTIQDKHGKIEDRKSFNPNKKA